MDGRAKGIKNSNRGQLDVCAVCTAQLLIAHTHLRHQEVCWRFIRRRLGANDRRLTLAICPSGSFLPLGWLVSHQSRQRHPPHHVRHTPGFPTERIEWQRSPFVVPAHLPEYPGRNAVANQDRGTPTGQSPPSLPLLGGPNSWVLGASSAGSGHQNEASHHACHRHTAPHANFVILLVLAEESLVGYLGVVWPSALSRQARDPRRDECLVS
jgi:hypothetical protein